MIPPLFNHSTPGAPSIARFLHTNHQNKGLIDRQSCIDIVFASCFCRPLVLHTWRTALKCTCPSWRYMYSHCAYMLHARSPFHCDGSWYLLNDLFCSSVCWSLCMRASRFRAQVPRSPRTVMARYHSRAGGCAWSRYPARSRWQARCPSTSGLRLAPTLGRTRLEQLWSEASLNELATQQKSTDLMIDDVS